MKTVAVCIACVLMLSACSGNTESTAPDTSQELSYNLTPITLAISGMSCQGCVQSVKEAIAKHEHASSVTINLYEEKAEFMLPASHESELVAIMESIQQAGYGAMLIHADNDSDS